jgi:predicted DsbA family dithiol-disulfide isomerase
LKRNYDVQVRWVAFPLHPETPEDGQTLEELFGGRPVDIEGMKKRLKQVADEVGLPLGDRKKTFNSRLAQELAKWAESQGKGDEFHAAVFHAYYADGKNIGNVDELVRLVFSVDLLEEGHDMSSNREASRRLLMPIGRARVLSASRRSLRL